MANKVGKIHFSFPPEREMVAARVMIDALKPKNGYAAKPQNETDNQVAVFRQEDKTDWESSLGKNGNHQFAKPLEIIIALLADLILFGIL